jgi:signal transduction histidine kinase
VRAIPALVLCAGAGLCALLIDGAHRGGWPPTDKAAIGYSAGLLSIAIGVVVWLRRPDTRTGMLLTAFPIASLAADLDIVFPASPTAITAAFACESLGAAFLVHAVLSYPTGRFSSRLDRGFVVFAYVYATARGLVLLLFYDPHAPHDPLMFDWYFRARPLTHVAWLDVTRIVDVFDGVLFAAALGLVLLLVRKVLRASPGEQRIVLPLVAATCFAALQVAVQLAVYREPVNSWASGNWFWVVTFASVATPLALALGILWGRRARSAVADLVVELERTPPGAVREALARTLRDPSLEIALCLERGGYADGEGRPVTLPASGSGRAVTVLGPADAPVAALVHDPVLLERPALLAAAGAAARLALENERLQAELRAQVAELRASRTRIVEAGDDERRRLERDLHDGAQQRLLAIGLALQLARGQLEADAETTRELLDEADAELRAALDELRELAHGIHPAVLTEQGLGPALATLAERSPVPVTIDGVPDERLPAPAEAAAYFLVSEALANVAKYAHASRIRVSVVRENGRARVEIHDDGVGGADPSRGSGLRGLLDRVQSLDGRLRIDSPPGRGTHLEAEIPCA